MELREALGQISAIRQQMARGEVFRGYRSLTSGLVGLLGVLGAILQPRLVGSPAEDLGSYLVLWLMVAAICFGAVGVEMLWRARRAQSGLAREMSLLAAEQFLPCVVVGAALTLVVYRVAPDSGWMLPGLWSLIFSLGVFASYRLLPRQIFLVGLFHLAAGVGCLYWGRGVHALSPWLMGVTFGGGPLLGAAILYWTLERDDG